MPLLPAKLEMAAKVIPCINSQNFKKYRNKRLCSEHFINKLWSKNENLEIPNISKEKVYYFPPVCDGKIAVKGDKSETIPVPKRKAKIVVEADDKTEPEHNYCFQPNAQKFKGLQNKINYLEHENSKLIEFTSENMSNRILNNMFYLNFYTNFSDLTQYNLFITTIIDHSKNLETVLGKKHIWDKCKLDIKTQILLVLMQLRLGLLETDVAFRYNLDQSTVSRNFQFWLNVIYSYVTQLPIWPSRNIVKKYMPESFKSMYPTTRIILDCTEIFIQKPSDYFVQSSTYSIYKSHNTAKGIVGITPNGFLSFVSKLYPGRISDKEIVIKSGILSQLEAGDSIMADRGFIIAEEVKKFDLTLNIPPLAQGISQFRPHDEQRTRDIASVRIYVERAICNIENFRILHETVPNTMADKLNQIWTVCCHLTNFTRIPLLERKP